MCDGSLLVFFFFKQKTAYEMRISDWSSDVCSSDLIELSRPIQTRFRCAYTYRLKLARYIKSLTHYARGTRSRLKDAPTACRHSVSGTVSLPSSGCFSPFPHGTGSLRSEEHTPELQSLMRISYAVFCLKKKHT